ncbi:MAG TPA: biopolymer transporter ExbD [Planctomycetaceae bacterium]|nr:biopolymer transporter ExbD [Planctomycetaceae bacterium]
MPRLSCPDCGQVCRLPEEYAGQFVRCPNCRARIEVFSPLPVSEPPPERRRDTTDDDREEPQMSSPPAEINPEELIDMTAMVDIVFFLLIFFLVTSMSGIHSSTKMPAPDAHEQEGAGGGGMVTQPADKQNIVVNIHRDDTLDIDGHACPSLEELTFRIQEAKLAAGPDATLMVVGHADATHGTAVAVLDAGYEAGIDQIRLAVTEADVD